MRGRRVGVLSAREAISQRVIREAARLMRARAEFVWVFVGQVIAFGSGILGIKLLTTVVYRNDRIRSRLGYPARNRGGT